MSMRALYRDVNGVRGSLHLPTRRYSDEIGPTTTVAYRAVNDVWSFERNFRPKLARARNVGETIEIVGAPWEEVDITCWSGVGRQSNEEGDAELAPFEAWAAALCAAQGTTLAAIKKLIGPPTWVGGNTSGAGGTAIIGPLQVMAFLHALRTRKPQWIVDLATGGASILDSWGTNGEDGLYKLQRDHANTFGGAPGANPPSLLGSIKRVCVDAGGEQDTHLSEHASQPTHYRSTCLALRAKNRTDWPASQVLANVVFALAPTAWTVNQTWLPYIISETLNQHDPNGTENGGVPTLVHQYADADMQPLDKPHIDALADGSAGWTRLALIAYNDLVARDIL